MKIKLLSALICLSTLLNAQNVGIGTSVPNDKSKLEIVSDSTGVLIPRMTTAQRTAMSSVAASMPNGLLVYDTDLDRFMYWDESLDAGGGAWNEVTVEEDKSHDWYEESTTSVPNDINDNIYTNGNVGIGVNDPQTTLQVSDAGADLELRIAPTGNAFNQINSGKLSFSEIDNNAGVCGFQFVHNGAEDKLFLESGCIVPVSGDTLMAFSRNGNISIKNQLKLGSNDIASATLDVEGTFQLLDGTQGLNEVLRSDATGNASWVKAASLVDVDNGLVYDGTAEEIQLGGALIKNTAINQGAFLMQYLSTAINGFSVDGTTFSVDAANNRVGIGTASPGRTLDVNGDIVIPNGTGSKSIYTWTATDENWRIGMNDAAASVGFTRALATAHVQYSTFASVAGQGFAVGDNVSGLSSFETTGSGNAYQSYFRGNMGIGTASAPYQLTLGGTGDVFGIENATTFLAKNSLGTYEPYLWPRWSDNITYMNFGSGGFNLRNNASQTAMFIDNDRSINIAKGVLFDCNDCGNTTTIDGTADWGDMTIQGRVLSANSNIHLSPPNGNGVIINSVYRAAGGAGGATYLSIDDNTFYRESATGNFGSAAGFNFGKVGVTIEQNFEESAGFHGDGDNADIWSPGDGDRILRFYDEDGMVERAYIDGDGDYFKASDVNKKEDLKPITDALDKVLTLEAYTYFYKLQEEEKEKLETGEHIWNRSVGVLAQDLEKVLPEAVQTDEEGSKFVSYEMITPLLIEAIKEQQKQIEELKALLNRQ